MTSSTSLAAFRFCRCVSFYYWCGSSFCVFVFVCMWSEWPRKWLLLSPKLAWLPFPFHNWYRVPTLSICIPFTSRDVSTMAAKRVFVSVSTVIGSGAILTSVHALCWWMCGCDGGNCMGKQYAFVGEIDSLALYTSKRGKPMISCEL